MLFGVLAALVFIADRLSKGLVSAWVGPGTEHQVLPHVWITNARNAGTSVKATDLVAPGCSPATSSTTSSTTTWTNVTPSARRRLV